ncbi:MAG: glycoside hydrolase family 3 C-terminal domain-containing protein [Oscillospiraceae bacterium]|jgi:beta-glucosidase|nr:glycoside hydrolase family 3 C-terminal domain-containing protein [Oscillospiraceae bacterium]
MTSEKAKALVSQLTLEEKAGLCSGRDSWHTKPVERLGIPACRTSDGPHGLRTQEGDVNNISETSSIPAVCFPSACASAASFDRDLLRRMGEELGRECQSVGVNVLLGPGVNIKRSPLCGRNFEYFSEDPLLAGEMGAALVQGLQSQGTGASLKHFFANNQEHRRMDSSSEMDERTMREIYLPAFEITVKNAQPWTIMASYNKIGGAYSTANKKYLSALLRDEWGFEGAVVSDWGATHDRAAAVKAGCDLTMPAENTDSELVAAVRDGRVSEEEIDACCERVISLAFKGMENHKDGIKFDYEGGHALARKIASQSVILLKNENNILPLDKAAKIAFIGGFAANPRYQGGGSSHINSFKISGALESARNAGLSVAFAQGYNNRDGSTDDALIAEAVKLAKESAVAVVFAGLPDIAETEGMDRKNMRMPEGHTRLIREVRAAQPNVAVVLHNGSPVEMPWADSVPAILEAYLGGQAVGEAVADVLFGDVNPSGHLAESFPKKLEDNPSYLFFPGENGDVQYSERMFVGYRYYESKKLEPLFPFGHGLSYTSFKFEGLTLDKTEISEGETLGVSVKVTNTGGRAGKALVQIYVAPPKGEIIRPVRELKKFEKVDLQPGESKSVSFILDERDFAHWNPKKRGWSVEDGAYSIQLGENSHNILLESALEFVSKEIPSGEDFCDTTIIKEFARHPLGKQYIEDNLGYILSIMSAAGFIPKEALEKTGYQPGSPISLKTALEYLTQYAEAVIDLLMNLTMAVMLNFLPEENKQAFKTVLDRIKKGEK